MAKKTGIEMLIELLGIPDLGVPGGPGASGPVNVDPQSSSSERGSGFTATAGGGSDSTDGGAGSGASSSDESSSGAAGGGDDGGNGGRGQRFNPYVQRGGKGKKHTSLSDRVSHWSRKTTIIAVIVLLLVLAGAYWWFHPAINIHSTDTWSFICILVIAPVFLVAWSKSRKYEHGADGIEPSPSKAKTFKYVSYIPVAVLLFLLAGSIMSLSIFPGNAAKYYNILPTQTYDFASDIDEVNYSEIPVIDGNSAILLGNREMGSIPEYVSQFEVSTLYSQINYQGTPVRVSPLNYADLFKWFLNRSEGIPAYVLVDMTTQDAQVVRLEDKPIHYSHSEPLVRNIDRHVQLSYPFYMFDQKAFEIDEDGQPWWICPVQKRTIGLFGGTTIQRVVLCNATTGECIDYAIEDVPQWVDRAYPSDLIVEQYNWHGKYENGWLNSVLGQSGVVQTTPGTDGMLGYNYIAKDDDVWLYTGVTSATADNSIVGFVLVNQRTAESHFYSVAGATEDSAMRSAEGQVQNLRYVSTFPLLLNVANQPTYFMALKDEAGLVKMFAMIDIQRYQNVAVGATVEDCQKAYEALLVTTGVQADPGLVAALNAEEMSGTIKTMTQVVIDGNSHFYLTLEGEEGIFDFPLPGFIKVVAYQVGDTITFTYIQSDPANTVNELLENNEVAATAASNAQMLGTEETAAGGGTPDAALGATGADVAAQGDAAAAG